MGDFGLVKDLQDVHCSSISGLTPVYAAPELFDGRPNNHSDQYSLAIVYQEMLTGVLPFEGRTTAQLAAQHLHSRPRLDRLPAADQADHRPGPGQRSRSSVSPVAGRWSTRCGRPRLACAAGRLAAPLNLAGLRCRPRRLVKTEHPALAGRRRAEPPSARGRDPGHRGPCRRRSTCRLLPGTRRQRLSAHDLHRHRWAGRPRAARSLHRRLVDRFGDINAIPALQTLVFDTDAETLKTGHRRRAGRCWATTRPSSCRCGRPPTIAANRTSTCNGSAAAGFSTSPARCKRKASARWDGWRWWITSSAWRSGIQRAISTAVDRQSVTASAAKSGLPFRQAAPRIFLVSSIAGGTGGGMVLDVAYLVRKLLRDMNLSAEGFSGVLAHCTGRNSQSRDLATANAYAFLSELHHYSEMRQGYPGDPACGLPAFGPQDAPFEYTYVLNLGEELEPKEFQAAADSLAQYLYLNTATTATAFFRKCRGAQEISANATPMVRTFGLSHLGFSAADVPVVAVDELCQTLAMRWRGAESREADETPASLADLPSLLGGQLAAGLSAEELRREVAARAAALDLQVAPIAAELQAAAKAEMGNDPEAYLLHVLAELLHKHEALANSPRSLPSPRWILDALDGLIRGGTSDTRSISLESVLDKYLQPMAARAARNSTIGSWAW